jgi:hypothetical protein
MIAVVSVKTISELISVETSMNVGDFSAPPRSVVNKTVAAAGVPF